MFIEPTINDFLDCIRTRLKREIDDAKGGMARIEHAASRAGLTGNTFVQIFDEVRNRYNDGIEFTLGELKRTIKRTTLDARELRQLTVQALMDFAIAAKSIVPVDRYRKLGGNRVEMYINGRVAEFDEHLKFCIRQFDTGFFDPLKQESSAVSKNEINIGSMMGGAIQQASPHATQTFEFALNLQAANNALASFEKAMHEVTLPDEARADMLNDVQTIRSQLSKRAPSKAIIGEAGRSLRNVVEGIAGGLLTPTAAAAASALWSALGLG
jgi:hypothetical protein